ncbi:hydantoin racemase [Astrocystis sublimbata]|nr:hydantoin racemase [Astrocystis sublimbata]
MSATALVRGQGTKILLLNPNSSSSMTDGMKTVINDIDLPHSTEIHTYTAPPTSGAPASINDAADIKASTAAVLSDFPLSAASQYDGIVIACFSVHPLVVELQKQAPKDDTPTTTDTTATTTAKPSHNRAVPVVTGIFESSILTSLSLLRPGEEWGIVTTGKFWEAHLSAGVAQFLGITEHLQNTKFAGVQSTGLNASDFHDGVDPAIVREKLKAATKRLLTAGTGNVSVIVMGCAGMAGLEDIIREAASEEYGDEFAYGVLHVVDGVRAGVVGVEQMVRNARLRPGRRGL